MTAARPVTVAFAHRGNNWIRGSEQCLLDLVSRLDRSRFEALVMCEQPVMAEAAAAAGARVVRLDAGEDWAVDVPRPVRARVRRVVEHTLVTHRVGLVHANATAAIPALLPAARRLRIPLVAHLHLPVTDEYQRLHELVHQADVIVGVAEHVVEPLRADGVDPRRMRVILNGVDAERLVRGDAAGLRGALGIPPDAIAAVSVGSLIERKGHDLTIRALARARARGVDAHLVLCGDGDERPALAALATELGVAPYAHFLGYRTDVGAVMRDVADVFVTSAREEMLPLNVLEAQCLGLPVVASDIAAHREALAPDVSGLLVAPERPDAVADALVLLSASPERRAALGAAGPRVVRERFTMARYVGDFEALYAELLSRPRGAYGWVRGTTWPPVYTAYARGVLGRRLRIGAVARKAAGAVAAARRGGARAFRLQAGAPRA